jgi:hypothetical protein
MFREDYVRRMVEQAVTAVTTILGLTRAGALSGSLSEVDRAARWRSGPAPEPGGSLPAPS